MNNPISETGERLKQARIKAGYPSAKDFYDKFNIKASTYSAHESGRNPLSIKTAKQYGKLLDISFHWLLTGSEQTETENPEKYLLHYGQVPRDILLNKMLNEATIQYIKSAGIEKGMTIVEYGCGTGSMACWLAEHTGSSGKVFAIDHGYEQLSIAKKRADELNINNIEFKRIDLTNTSLDIKADLIYMRCFLHHVNNPKDIISTAINNLNKNGILICMEPILSSFYTYPPIPEMNTAINLYIKLGEMHSLDFNIGEKLYGYMNSYTTLENFQAFIYKGIGITKFEKSWIEMITAECATRYINEGLTTESEMDNILARISEHINNTATIATLPEFVCITAKK